MSKETSAPLAVWFFLTGRPDARDEALAPKAFWSPYAAGVLLGITLFLAFFVMGRGVGASGSMNRMMAAIYALFSEGFAASLHYYQGYFGSSRSVLYNYAVFQILGVFVGGYVSAALGRRAHLTVERGPRIDLRSRFALAFTGGAIMAIGARIARGCTSGQVLTGSANLAIGSLIMFVCFFAGAYAVAYVVRKQWI
ncbi:MAG TPA: YeeE/YedE thiosulfate transporter family protein [bacterium]|nr:YeeE/YedE thiosulfate transporter family protein [bacterium]